MGWVTRDQGFFRAVFLTRSHAIKLPRLTFRHDVTSRFKTLVRAMLCNMQEVEFSRMDWPELCPVVFSLPLGLLVVMRRAEEVPDDVWSEVNYREFVTRGDHYAGINFDSVGGHVMNVREPECMLVPAENKKSSFGMLDGRVVCIDYGGCP